MFSRRKSPPPGKGGKTLIIHIGDHKTGSTSIRNAFASGRVQLSKASVDYPTPLNHNYLKPHFAGLTSDDPAQRRRAQRVFRRLARAVRDSRADFCLISAEEMAGIGAPLVHRAVTEFLTGCADRIQVVGYVRPHAGKILSSFAEQAKIGNFQHTLEDFVNRQVNHDRALYMPRFSLWQELFGEDFSLRPMQRELLHQGSVVHDFVHGCFGDPFEIAEGPQDNESLGLEDLMRVRVVQSRLQGCEKRQRHTFGWEMARAMTKTPAQDKGSKLQLYPELATQIREACLDDARAMDRTFFGGDNILEAALEQAVTSAAGNQVQSTMPADHLSAAERRSLEMFGDIAAAMMTNETGNWPTFFRDRRITALRNEE